MIELNTKGGLPEGAVGYEAQQRLVSIFQMCLQLQEQKLSTYGNAWRDQGWVGNVGRVLSKASRLKNMLWRDQPLQHEESVEDTLMDLINLAAFAFMNREDGNKWGNGRA